MGKHMSEREFKNKMSKIKKNNAHKQKQLMLKAEKEKYKNSNHIETSKLIAVYLFGLLNAIIIYSMIAMWRFGDFSYLGVLISDIAAQVLIYAIYCMKAYHGKKQSEQMKFDREKLKNCLGDVLDAGSKCQDTVPLTKGSVDDAMTSDEAVG